MYNFSKEIEDAVRLQLIKEFIESNNRVPSDGEINSLLYETYQNLKKIDSNGLIRSSPLPLINEESSSSFFNKKIKDYYFNASFLFEQIEYFFERLTERAFVVNNLLSNLEKKYRNLNSLATSALLAKGINSNLLYSIVEDFSSLAFIKTDETTASISSSGVFSQKENISIISPLSSFEYSIFSTSGYTRAVTSGTLDSILDVDGDFWTLDVYTSFKTGNVAIQVETELSETIYVSDVTFNTVSSVNSFLNCYTAGEDKNYSLVFTSGLDVNTLQIPIDAECKYIKFMITKQSSDSISGSDFVYSFKIDSITINDSNSINNCILIAGPYQFKDAFNEIVSFSFVQLAVCEQKKKNAWIDYYLSSDNSTWISVDPFNTGGSIVNFQAVSLLSDIDVVNEDISIDLLDYENIMNLNLDTNDSYLNQKVDISYLNILNPSNILIKRNLPTSNEVFDTSSGWFFDEDTSLYTTTIVVNTIEGVTLDLGDTSAYLDGVIVTGSFVISPGEHTFSTNQSNWFEVEEGIESENSLIDKDPLYPFNHKLLIEGYNYSLTFSGNKKYNGFTEYYGKTLTYVSRSEFFNSKELSVYSIESDADYIYFLIKTKKGYDDWKNEKFKIEISIPNTDVDSIYLKAIFRNSDDVSTVVLKNFTLRAG